MVASGTAPTEARAVDAGAGIWWGDVALEEGETARCSIGPLTLWVTRLALEWRIAHAAGRDPLADGVGLARRVPDDEIPASAERARLFARDAAATLRLTPLLADRPVVVRPEHPLTLPPSSELSLYLSTAVWVRAAVGPHDDRLAEVPALRPSDTWFGPSTTEGELCYSSRTAARLLLDQLPLRPHRAVTRVHVRNDAAKPLLIERLALPVPHLAVHGTAGGVLWTDSVRVERADNGGLSAARVVPGAPEEAGPTSVLSGPRAASDDNLLTRALGALLG